jgi:hypothetical protein
MKRLLIALPILLAATFVQAQHHDLKFNAAGMLVKTPGFFYEFSPNANNGFGAGINHSWLNLTIDGESYSFRNTSFIADYRRYFRPRRDADGFFAGAYLKGGNAIIKLQETGDQGRVGKFAVGATAGWKLVTEGGFVLETYGGLGKNFLTGAAVNDTNLNKAVNWIGFMDFRVGVTVGYRLW